MYKQHDFVITLSANLRSSVIQRIKKNYNSELNTSYKDYQLMLRELQELLFI